MTPPEQPSPAETHSALEAAARIMFDTAARLDWRSHDPFDLLLSPYLGPLRRRAPFLGRVAVQVGKRSGTTLRAALRVPRHVEAKALSDFLRAAVLLTSAGQPWTGEWIEPLEARLRATGTHARDTRGWGLSFPYVSRFTNADAGTPNVYITTAAVEALLDAADTGSEAGAEAAREGARFLVDELGTFRRGGFRWMRYWPANPARIVNVQASGASLLARVGRYFSDPGMSDLADELAATVVRAQRPDGSWHYSAELTGAFVDGFHTGFTLQGLTEYAGRRGDESRTAMVRPAIRRGLDYFHDRLMTQDGLPLGFAGGRVSLDPQNVAQCIQTLVVCARDERDPMTAWRLWKTTAGDASRRPATALRWALGPRALATAHLLRSLDDREPRTE